MSETAVERRLREMAKLAQRVAGWHQGERSGRTSTAALINDLLAALRDRPAPPDALVANLNVRHDEALHTAIGWMSQEENLVTTREALIELLMMLKPVIFAAPAPVAAPAPEPGQCGLCGERDGQHGQWCQMRKPAPETHAKCNGQGIECLGCAACETPAPDAMPEANWPDANNAVRWKPNDVVGHTTVRDADGALRHEPLTREVAEALWKTAEEARLRRVASMPDERAAIAVLFSAWLRLKELGWKEAEYCPKDGTPFEAIEPGSTGVHRCHYEGKWPDGRWWTSDEHDMYPSRPILWRRQEAQP